MRILNNSYHDIVIRGNTVHHPYAITVVEQAFNTQAIFSDIGSVEITTEYSKRSFRCFGQLAAYESSCLIDTGGMPVIVIVNKESTEENQNGN
jgi:hypothetical protein